MTYLRTSYNVPQKFKAKKLEKLKGFFSVVQKYSSLALEKQTTSNSPSIEIHALENVCKIFSLLLSKH